MIREFIRGCLREAAVNATQASGMALYVMSDGSEIKLMMYDPKIALDWANLAIEGDDLDDEVLMNALEKSARGIVVIREPHDSCNGAYEVANSAAEKGFGPLMYDIAMAAAPNHAIMSDRSKVSSAAGNVWRHYYDSRGDVEKKPLDNVEEPKTPDPHDDCTVHGDQKRPFLDFSYSSGGTDPHAMINNHMRFLDQLARVLKPFKYWGKENIANMIEIYAADMFQRKYANETAKDPFAS